MNPFISPQAPVQHRVTLNVKRRQLSALRWGSGPPRVVFLHGGGQNAHTWDRVARVLGEPALAVDLPGHGHSAWREDHDYTPERNAESVAPLIAAAGPDVKVIVGMSLGGLTLIALAAQRPRLVPRAVIVDVLPTITARSQVVAQLQDLRSSGERSFDSRAAMVERAMRIAPHRSRASVAQGVVYNSVMNEDGSWRWRWDPDRRSRPDPVATEKLWQAMASLPLKTTLVRGGRSDVVPTEALVRMAQISPWIEDACVEGAGHAIQSDKPDQLVVHIRRHLSQRDQRP